MNEVYIKKEELNSWVAKYFQHQDLITIDDLICCIENLDEEVDYLKEQIENMEQDVEDNYKPVKKDEQYGISYSDFI